MRMGVLDPGSVNLGSAGEDGLPGGFDVVYSHSYGDVRYVVAQLDELRIGPSVSIFEPGFLRTALVYHRRGKLPRGALIKLYFGGDASYLGDTGASGVTFGLPPTVRALEAYLEMLDGSGCRGRWRSSAATSSRAGSRAPRSSAGPRARRARGLRGPAEAAERGARARGRRALREGRAPGRVAARGRRGAVAARSR
jgi:hypothetical protein